MPDLHIGPAKRGNAARSSCARRTALSPWSSMTTGSLRRWPAWQETMEYLVLLFT
jgi:hypothetical protein